MLKPPCSSTSWSRASTVRSKPFQVWVCPPKWSTLVLMLSGSLIEPDLDPEAESGVDLTTRESTDG